MADTSQRKITTYDLSSPSRDDLLTCARELNGNIQTALWNDVEQKIEASRKRLASPAAEKLMGLAGAEFSAQRAAIKAAKDSMALATEEDEGSIIAAMDAVRAALASGLPQTDLPFGKSWGDFAAEIRGFRSAQNALNGARHALDYTAALYARQVLRAGAASGRIARTLSKVASILGKERDPLMEEASKLSPDEARMACERLRCETAYALANLYGCFRPCIPNDESGIDRANAWKITRQLEDVHDFLKDFVTPDTGDSSAAWKAAPLDKSGRGKLDQGRDVTSDIKMLRRRSESTTSDSQSSDSRSRTIRHEDSDAAARKTSDETTRIIRKSA